MLVCKRFSGLRGDCDVAEKVVANKGETLSNFTDKSPSRVEAELLLLHKRIELILCELKQ